MTAPTRASLLVSIGAATLVACREREPETRAADTARAAEPTRATPEAPPPAPYAVTEGAPVAPNTLRRIALSTTTSYVIATPTDVDEVVTHAREKAPELDVRAASLVDVVPDLDTAVADLSQEDRQRIRALERVVLLRGTRPVHGAIAQARRMANVSVELAQASGGWVIDPDTVRAFTASAFGEHVPGPTLDARTLIMVRNVFTADQQPIVETLGMRRYGLPELYVVNVEAERLTAMDGLVTAAAQHLLGGGDVDARGDITVDVVFGTRWTKRPGHEHPVIELVR